MDLPNIPYISVIIPVYNRSHLIQRALNSIFSQTYSNFEVIVVDDGSSDNLDNVINLYSDSRLRFIKHLNNKGAGAARNTAIKLSRGKLIAFLDSDDEWMSEKLEQQVNHFDVLRSQNENVKASFTWFFLHRSNGDMELRHSKKVKNWKKYFLGGCSISPGSTLLIDREVYECIGLYDESLARLEDWDWLIRFSHKFDLVLCGKPLSHIYRGSLPSSDDVSFSLHRVKQKYWRDFSLNEKRIFLSAVKLELSYSYLKENHSKAFFYFLLSVIMNPFFVIQRLCFLKKRLNIMHP